MSERPRRGGERGPALGRGALWLCLCSVVVWGGSAAWGAEVVPLGPPPEVTVTPGDNFVRLSWPDQPDSVLTKVGIPLDDPPTWTGFSRPLASGVYQGSCDQDYLMEVRQTELLQGRLRIHWSEVPLGSQSLQGFLEITRADSYYVASDGVAFACSSSTRLITTDADTVVAVAGAPPEPLAFVGGWTNGTAVPRSNGLYLRGVEGAIVFTASAGGEVFADHTTPDTLTLDWHFVAGDSGTPVVRASGVVTIPRADTLVWARWDSISILPPDTTAVPFLRVALGAGTVAAGDSFVVDARPSVRGGDYVLVSAKVFEGYAIWRSEVIDLDRPIFRGKIPRCASQLDPFYGDRDSSWDYSALTGTHNVAELEAFFATPYQAIIDTTVHNGYPYYYAVTVSDAEIDSISQDLWLSLRQKVYPRKVAWDSAYVNGTSPFPNADLARVVPNPYKGFEEWQEGDPKVQFINLPAQATVYVYTESGDFVISLRQNDPASDRLSWDLRNGSGRDVVSGIYMFKVESPRGEKEGRFVVIR